MRIEILFLIVVSTISLDNDPIHTALLYGGYDLGYYYVNIYLGTPPNRQTVIVDTGSQTTTLPCVDCGTDCGQHIDDQFNYKSSQTAKFIECHENVGNIQCNQCDHKNRCSFNITYAENSSLQGFFIRDQILIGDQLYRMYTQKEDLDIVKYESFQTVFGCTTRETNLFVTQLADGIMGLAPTTNNTDLPNLIDDLYSFEYGSATQLSFSICFGIQGGYMSFGSYDRSRHMIGSPTYSVPYDDSYGFYKINIQWIKVGQNKLNISENQINQGAGAFIDSGSTIFHANTLIYNQLLLEFNTTCGRSQCPDNYTIVGGQMCYFYNDSAYPNKESFYNLFPVITFKLDTFEYDWGPQDYFLQGDNNTFCVPIVSAEGEQLILGGVWMRNQDILFDRKNKMIQFTRSNCSTSQINHSFTNEERDSLKQINFARMQRQSVEPQNESWQLKEEYIQIGSGVLVVFALLILLLLCIRNINRRRQERARYNDQQSLKLQANESVIELRAENNVTDNYSFRMKQSENQSLDTSMNYVNEDYHFELDNPQEQIDDLTDVEDHAL